MTTSTTQTLDVSKILGQVYGDYEVKITHKDLILYAVSLGFNRDGLKESDYKFTNEMHPEFTSFPPMPVVLATREDFNKPFSMPGMENVNPMMILHGSEDITIHKQLEVNKRYRVVKRYIDV